jgi:hypothetical protein
MTLQDHPLDFNDVPPARKARSSTRMSVAQLAELLNDRIGDLAVALLGTPNRELSSQQQLRFGTKGSVAVEIAVNDAGRWYDHEAGTGGAGLELICHHFGLDEKSAWDWARNWLGEAAMPASWTTKPAIAPASGTAKPVEMTDAERATKVAEIVRQTESPNGTPVHAYLLGRGIALQPPDCIWFRQNAYGSYGAMVALATDAQGEVLAIQQVYLTADGKKAPLNPVKRTNKAVEGWADTRPKDLYIGSDVEIAKRVREDLTAHHGRIVHAEGTFWRYGGTEWEAIEDHLIRLPAHAYDGADFMTAAGEPSRVKLSRSRMDSVLNECAAVCAEPHFFENPPAGINCASGFIRFDAAGTPHLEPHHRNNRCRRTLPGHWDAGMPGTAPEGSLLHRLLTGSFRGDPEAQAKCDLMAEICGSAALGYATRLLQPRAVVLHGKTAENGKSQILQLARGLLPANAICCVPASQMGDERHVLGLVSKLLNASDELSVEAIASDTFKAVVTGDPAQGRDVYKSRVEFRSVAQNLFATNNLPSFKGGVDRGVQRHLLVIPFARTIPLEERIADIGKQIASDEADLLLASVSSVWRHVAAPQQTPPAPASPAASGCPQRGMPCTACRSGASVSDRPPRPGVAGSRRCPG